MSDIIEANSGIRGRLRFGLSPIEKYTVGIDGKPPVKPVMDELSYKTIQKLDGTGPSWVIMKCKDPESNLWEEDALDLRNVLTDIVNSGILADRSAYLANKNIDFFMYDPVTKLVTPNTDNLYPPEYKYYSIELVEPDENGHTVFVTGYLDEINGTIIGTLQPMKIINDPGDVSGGGGKKSVCQPGSLSPLVAMKDNGTYIVKFYDQDAKIITRPTSFISCLVTGATHDLTSEVAVTGLEYTSIFKNLSTDMLELQQHTTFTANDLNVQLRYMNKNRLVDITHEYHMGGALSIEGVNDIDTSLLSIPGSPNQKITLNYILPNLNGTGESTRLITKDIEIKIIPNTTEPVRKFVPIFWVTQGADPVIKYKIYAIYKSGHIGDVTSKVIDTGMFNPSPFIGGGDGGSSTQYQNNITFRLATGVGSTIETLTFDIGLTRIGEIWNVSLTTTGQFTNNIYRTMNYNSANIAMKLIVQNAADPVQLLLTENSVDIDNA